MLNLTYCSLHCPAQSRCSRPTFTLQGYGCRIPDQLLWLSTNSPTLPLLPTFTLQGYVNIGAAALVGIIGAIASHTSHRLMLRYFRSGPALGCTLPPILSYVHV